MLRISRRKSKSTPAKINNDVVLNPFKPLILKLDSIKFGTTVSKASNVEPIKVRRLITRLR